MLHAGMRRKGKRRLEGNFPHWYSFVGGLRQGLMSSNLFVLTPAANDADAAIPSPRRAWTLLLLIFLAVHFMALFSPSLLDDADATHAEAARHIALSGDWVTLKIDGIRYLEKPPLPYWLAAIDFRVFGSNVAAAHLPLNLGVLALALLAWIWGRRAWGDRAGFYAALSVLTSIGVFLFTRILIPEVLLTFLLGLTLYAFLTGLEDRKPGRIYLAWASLAAAVLAKGLVGPVFICAATIPYLFLTGDWRRWRELRLPGGFLLFLAIAAPWHILAGLRNPGFGHPSGNIPQAGNVHGFLYFYFVNEHFLRFLNKRYPHDYNKLPAVLYWSLHLIWLFPWSIFAPLALGRAWKARSRWWRELRNRHMKFLRPKEDFRKKTTLLLALYGGFILLFFSFSTNQEYYTYPAYLPLLLLTAGSLAAFEREPGAPRRWLDAAHAIFLFVGAWAAGVLSYGLWVSRQLPAAADIGRLLVRRNVAGYTLSMAHFFDLTGASFASLRLPAALAAATLLIGPVIAWKLRRAGQDVEATTSVAFTAAIFLVAAHLAFVRFEPVLSSRAMADTVNRIVGLPDKNAAPGQGATLLLYGDPAKGSSLIFYTHRQALLVNGRRGSMLWGSYYPDAPKIFLDDRALVDMWGKGPREFLFVPAEAQTHVAALLGSRAYLLQRISGRSLYTDRPLAGE